MASIKINFVVTSSLKTLVPNTDNLILLFEYILYIYYLYYFLKNKKNNIKTLINSNNEANIMILAYVKRLSFWTWKIDVVVQKIERSNLVTYKVIIIKFQVLNKLDRAYFFQKNGLLTNTSNNVILKLFFLTFNNTDIIFVD